MNAIIKFNSQKHQLGAVVLVFVLCIALSCEKVEDPIIVSIEAGDWEIFQLAKLHVPEIASNDTAFQGTIGGHPVTLGRMPGDTLVFLIPDIGTGSKQLQVQIGNQEMVWDMELSYWPYYPDEDDFFEEFI